jgi:nucleotide-binding universal stress UspA family protein
MRSIFLRDYSGFSIGISCALLLSMDYNKKLKVLWAVDALDHYPAVMKKIADTLLVLRKSLDLEISPVFVLSPEQLGLSIDLDSIKEADPFHEGAQRALKQCLEGFEHLGILKPEILVEHRSSVKSSVLRLVEYADKNSFDLVITGTHGKRGFERMMIGSFTEVLMLTSKKPVLVVGGESKIDPSFSNILVPSDLKGDYEGFYKSVMGLAKKLGANITALAAVPRPVDAIIQSGTYLFSGGWVSLSLFSKNQIAHQEAKIKSVKVLADSLGVRCETVVDHQCLGAEDSILAHAKNGKASLIVMESQSGLLATTLLGSVTRQVVRDAPCPVLVVKH